LLRRCGCGDFVEDDDDDDDDDEDEAIYNLERAGLTTAKDGN
jgi:hypothetical protein